MSGTTARLNDTKHHHRLHPGRQHHLTRAENLHIFGLASADPLADPAVRLRQTSQ